jgi:hypothetical protein
MPYIGKGVATGNFVKLDAITASSTATYALTNGGVAFTPESVNQMIVSLNGVIQNPGTSFSLSGSDSIDFILVFGSVLDVGVPTDNTVSLAKLTATGTKNSTTFLRGDNTFAEPLQAISWQATKTGDFTAVAGEGYFVDTTSGAIAATLPGTAARGDQVAFIDYAGTFDTNNLTVNRNSHKIQGDASNLTVATERAAFMLVYIDATQGWLLTENN